MTNLVSSNQTKLKHQNFDRTEKITPNSNYFVGRFVKRSRR